MFIKMIFTILNKYTRFWAFLKKMDSPYKPYKSPTELFNKNLPFALQLELSELLLLN